MDVLPMLCPCCSRTPARRTRKAPEKYWTWTGHAYHRWGGNLVLRRGAGSPRGSDSEMVRCGGKLLGRKLAHSSCTASPLPHPCIMAVFVDTSSFLIQMGAKRGWAPAVFVCDHTGRIFCACSSRAGHCGVCEVRNQAGLFASLAVAGCGGR